jgi:ATP phosphoribosyltransferase regulatory subunit
MDEGMHPALLPVGLRDLLPPEARAEARAVERLMASLASHGYERVKPPLFEYETSLLHGPGAAMASETFRLMDPISQRMVGVRADMTLQIARIASTRLVNAPRPLRLAYAGQVLRVRGSQLHPERQISQVGAELIGSDAPEADAEVIGLAAHSLLALGVDGLSVDLTLPPLVPLVLAGFGLTEQPKLRAALDRKDAASVAEQGGAAAAVLGRLMSATGPAPRALAALAGLKLAPEPAAIVAGLARIVDLVAKVAPGLVITVDPVENRGFEYHTGVSFAFFARNVRSELGRGGRYVTDIWSETPGAGPTGDGEPSTGFTLYGHSLLRALPAPPAEKRLYLPYGLKASTGADRRAEGWVTVAGLTEGDARAEARRLQCSHLWLDGRAIEA